MTSTENAKKIMAQLVEQFSRENFPMMAAKAYIVAPEIPSSKWSFWNRLAMMAGGTADARGYKQWREVGRYPKKGSKAIYILAPRVIMVADEDGKEDKRVIGFRAVPVFRFEDTDGTDLPDYKPRKLPPLYNLAKSQGLNVRYANSNHGEYGSINSVGTITLSTESPDTFLHELVHHYDFKTHDTKSGQDKTQEIVAQLGACTLAAMYGHDAKEYTWNYIAHYSDTKEPEKIGMECHKVLERVDAAITAILTDAEKLEPESQNQ